MPKRTPTPLTNTKFGHWTFLRAEIIESKTYWRIRCKCGKKYFLSPSNIHNSKTKMCKDCVRAEKTPKLDGRRFTSLKVIKLDHTDGNNKYYECLCDCGNIRVCKATDLRLGNVKRCESCRKKTCISHGMKGTSVYNIWMGIKARCNNPNNKAYINYGGRGIRLSKPWHKFENFYKDMGDRPEGLQIDRINNNRGYFKSNCRWVTSKENQNNRWDNIS